VHVVQKWKRRSRLIFRGQVEPGEMFTFNGMGKHGTMGPRIGIFINKHLNARMHTRCSEPIGPGLVRGLFEVVEGYSRKGGSLCPVPPPGEDCGACQGKVTRLTLRFLGDRAAHVHVTQKRKRGERLIFRGRVEPGEMFTFDGMSKKGTMGPRIRLYMDRSLNTRIHTSCSEPIGPGLVSGLFEVVEGYSREGGLLCPLR